MFRAVSHLPRAQTYNENGLVASLGHVLLTHGERRIRRKLLEMTSHEEVLVDLPEPVTLHHGDALVLESGALITVIAAREALYAVTGRDQTHLARLAWHIGNRHTPAQIEADRIVIAHDHVLKAMLEGLGATVTAIDEPFSPEHGAYHAHAHGAEPHALSSRR